MEGIEICEKNSSNAQAEFRDLAVKKKKKRTTTTTGYEIPDDDWRAKPLLISRGREIFASRKLHARRVEQRIKGRAGEINFQRNLIRRGIKREKKKKGRKKRREQKTKQRNKND